MDLLPFTGHYVMGVYHTGKKSKSSLGQPEIVYLSYGADFLRGNTRVA